MFDIITIGTATKDVFMHSSFFKNLNAPKRLKNRGFVSGEALCLPLDAKIKVDEPITTIGGNGANAAITFARQGFKTAALLKTGNDAWANHILKEVKKEKIFPCLIRKNSTTASSIIMIGQKGERTILETQRDPENLKFSDIPLKKIKKANWVYLSPGREIPLVTVEKLIDYFHKQGAIIALNPSNSLIKEGLSKLKPLLNKTGVFILNFQEAAYLTKIDYAKKKEIFKKIDKIVGGISVLTDGEKGTWVSNNRFIYEAKTFRVKALDETGAGDAFGSGFVAGLMQKGEKCRKGHCRSQNIEYAVRLGSANAASVVQKIGAQEGIITKKEFEKNKKWVKLPIKITKV